MIMQKGTAEITGFEKLPHYEDEVKYNFFTEEIFGVEEVLHDLVRFFRAGANRTETGKRILILVGPVSSGKSTIVSLLKRGMEQDADAPVSPSRDCPVHEEPLHLVPRSQRPEFETLLGVKIEGDLCPVCKYRLTTEREWRDHDGNYKWEDIPGGAAPPERALPRGHRHLPAVGPQEPGHLGAHRPRRPRPGSRSTGKGTRWATSSTGSCRSPTGA